MDKIVNRVIKRLDVFTPEGGSFIEIDNILAELLDVNDAMPAFESMYKVFERYPNNYNETMWTIVHTLEDSIGYEEELINSLRRKPTKFTLTMLNRILNTGQKKYKEYDLLKIIEEILANPNSSRDIGNYAFEIYNKHR
ncbi:hypothetical protein [Acetivibrio cellulolyticus]|uniref:hypothetical protein n=1 Tax=Acetivibrio cellulolyticus TaxID=35830 RepID=UPI0001E2F567|nr:hypothetical protein [Acetivibrio cellulolyticus]